VAVASGRALASPTAGSVGRVGAIFSAADSHILPAWAAEISGGGTRSVSAVVDISGWYFFPGGASIHHFAAGPRYTFRTPGRNRGFLQVVAGSSLIHAPGGTAMRGLVLVPGGGVDVALPARRLAVRVQGDYFGVYYPGDYEYRWDHAWRASTGLVFQLK